MPFATGREVYTNLRLALPPGGRAAGHDRNSPDVVRFPPVPGERLLHHPLE